MAGVAPEVNLRERVTHTSPPSSYKAAYSGFETLRRHHQKSKKDSSPPNFFLKKKARAKRLLASKSQLCGVSLELSIPRRIQGFHVVSTSWTHKFWQRQIEFWQSDNLNLTFDESGQVVTNTWKTLRNIMLILSTHTAHQVRAVSYYISYYWMVVDWKSCLNE